MLFEQLWHEPRAPHASSPLSRDWLLVALLVPLAIAEGILNNSILWRPLSTAVALLLVLTLPWRRVHPLGMVVLAFGTTGIVHAAAMVLGEKWLGLTTNIIVVVLPYALLRWGSGREAAMGLVLIAISLTLARAMQEHSLGEALGAGLFLLFPATLGASVRYRDSARRRANEQVRLREREQLARELHDTVAHHVSAIAIQAQAGRALAARREEAPLEALAIIEEAASRTLTEMRLIVGALRENEAAERQPAAALMDIERLALDDACPLEVNVTLTGDLNNLNTMLQSTVYRLAQEAVTNAARHAIGAQSVSVKVAGESEHVHLTVEDDGDPVTQKPVYGFGLRGMTERVALNGGVLHTGPGIQRGWRVEARLSKRGKTS